MPGYQVVHDRSRRRYRRDAQRGHAGHAGLHGTRLLAGYRPQRVVLQQHLPAARLEVTDNVGQGHVWQLNDPEGQPNPTGGSGNFADINSDFYGPGNTQNTALVTPTLDLSTGSRAGPDVRATTTSPRRRSRRSGMWTSARTVAPTWTNVWHHTGDSVPGPGVQTVPLPTAANQGNVKVRFHFTSTFGFWWMVDDSRS